MVADGTYTRVQVLTLCALLLMWRCQAPAGCLGPAAQLVLQCTQQGARWLPGPCCLTWHMRRAVGRRTVTCTRYLRALRFLYLCWAYSVLVSKVALLLHSASMMSSPACSSGMAPASSTWLVVVSAGQRAHAHCLLLLFLLLLLLVLVAAQVQHRCRKQMEGAMEQQHALGWWASGAPAHPPTLPCVFMASMSCCLSAWLASFWSNRLLLSLSTSSTLGPMMLVGLHAAEKQVGREQLWLWVRSVCTVLAVHSVA